MLSYIYVMLGGALGTGARFWASGIVARRFGEVFPLGTLTVNIAGSFIIGFFGTLTDADGRFLVAPSFRQFFMIGICGGFTTFSSFSLQTLELAQEGDWLKAGLNAVLSLVCCLLAVGWEESAPSRLGQHRRRHYENSRRGDVVADFVGENHRWHHQPLYEAIVMKTRELHLAGATVLRGPIGFGAKSHIHTAKLLRLSMDLPMVIEIVESEEKINAFLPVLDEMMDSGLVTLERAQVIHYRSARRGKKGGSREKTK